MVIAVLAVTSDHCPLILDCKPKVGDRVNLNMRLFGKIMSSVLKLFERAGEKVPLIKVVGRIY